jgi:microcystin-dependent protein
MASEPYIAEIRIFGGNFAPQGWAFCNGQTMSIDQNEALFNLIGTTYGGDGVSTFNLPDLRGRLPIHQGQGLDLSPYVIGGKGGTEQVAITLAELPSHTHTAQAAKIGNTDTPAGNYPATDPAGNVAQYKANTTENATMAGTAISQTGGGVAHSNIQPVLAVSYIISMFGVFPSRN